MKTFSRPNFLVSASTCEGITTATPTRYFAGTHKFQHCDLYGQTFPSSEEAFKAMDERGYTEPYFGRSSVALSLFANLAHHRQQYEFDALYRLLKHYIKTGRCSVVIDGVKARLRQRAKSVRILHPVARVYLSPRFLKLRKVGKQWLENKSGPVEVSLLERKPLKLSPVMREVATVGTGADCSTE